MNNSLKKVIFIVSKVAYYGVLVGYVYLSIYNILTTINPAKYGDSRLLMDDFLLLFFIALLALILYYIGKKLGKDINIQDPIFTFFNKIYTNMSFISKKRLFYFGRILFWVFYLCAFILLFLIYLVTNQASMFTFISIDTMKRAIDIYIGTLPLQVLIIGSFAALSQKIKKDLEL